VRTGPAATLLLVKRRQLLVAAVATLAAGCAPRAATSTATQYPAALAANPSLGVWPAAYRSAPAGVQTAYHFAAANSAILRYIPCFCGCGLSSGHQNNYDCFVKSAKPEGWVILDPHGLNCGTCVGVALDVIAMRDGGMTLKAIRAAVDDRWASTGPATQTPYP